MTRQLSSTLVAILLAACSSDVEVPATTSGSGGATSSSSSTGGAPQHVPPTLESAHAPDETTVEVQLAGDVGALFSLGLQDVQLTSEVGDLAVVEVSYDDASKVITLTTDEQKLGIEYSLTLIVPGGELDGASASFLSADTAKFWAFDFGTFDNYELVADRVAVGAETVVYVEQGQPKQGADALISFFESEVLPLESDLFTTPPDQDGNGKVLFLGLDGGPYFGGYFSPIDAYPSGEFGQPSNEMEMLYINTQYDLASTHVIAHEFQHLLYHQQHGLVEDWNYHNEGLSECAVRAVLGENYFSVQTFMTDPTLSGLSLVDWEYGNFSQYALAYMFWTYLAAQGDGVDTYGELFQLPTGSPAEVDAFVQQKLGVTMDEAQRNMMLAARVHDSSGPYSYGSMETLSQVPLPVTSGTTSLSLPAFSGAFFQLAETSVDYPGSQGPNIGYAGVNAQGDVDLSAPFDVSGGALLVFNHSLDFNSFPVEPSGPELPALVPPSPQAAALAALAHPPLRNPLYPQRLQRWRQRWLAQQAR